MISKLVELYHTTMARFIPEYWNKPRVFWGGIQHDKYPAYSCIALGFISIWYQTENPKKFSIELNKD